MKTYTDQQLKLALAKMLPETIAQRVSQTDLGSTVELVVEFVWINSNGEHPDDWLEVRDTELLHLCWMLEETLTGDEDNYFHKIDAHATWQERTIELATTKGIEIV